MGASSSRLARRPTESTVHPGRTPARAAGEPARTRQTTSVSPSRRTSIPGSPGSVGAGPSDEASASAASRLTSEKCDSSTRVSSSPITARSSASERACAARGRSEVRSESHIAVSRPRRSYDVRSSAQAESNVASASEDAGAVPCGVRRSCDPAALSGAASAVTTARRSVRLRSRASGIVHVGGLVEPTSPPGRGPSHAPATDARATSRVIPVAAPHVAFPCPRPAGGDLLRRRIRARHIRRVRASSCRARSNDSVATDLRLRPMPR